MSEVYITNTSHFFPNNPVSNDEMEEYLGLINGKPSLARRIVLSKNGIKSRYYALDKHGNVTHTNVQMAVSAINALRSDSFNPLSADVLALGTASPELIMPSPAIMVHGDLEGADSMEVVSFQGSCCASLQALKYCFMSLSGGFAKKAVCAASERLSALMRAENFKAEGDIVALQKKPILAFEKEFLRWMLSDGAAALALTTDKPADALSLRIDWIELVSYANEVETCMYLGGEKNEDGQVIGWNMFPQEEWLRKSLFSLKQDTRILGSNIVNKGGEFLMKVTEKHGLKAEDIDWFLPHLSSMFFKDEIFNKFKELGYYIPEEKWFINLPKIGNVATVSAFAMIDELFHSGRLRKGQRVLVMAPESARFSYAYVLLTVC
ncbi:MAG: beta-ketoacyl-ACP synthase III [Bacteroidales bacterium]|nr:beta-ketoacyl-ACP synthase III [Candidatus Physcocola equi]